jgi:hypothetical protein
MENFKEIAEKCLAGELSGTFVTAFGNNWHSSYLQKHAILGHEMPSQYVLGPGVIYNAMGQCESREKVKIIDFIPDNMQKKIEIDIPEGKVPVMEQTEKGVVITWKEEELTYDIIESKLDCCIPSFKFLPNLTSIPFYNKVEVLRKLTNIRNYFGKPTDGKGYGIFYHEYYKKFYVDVLGPFNPVHVCFSTKEQAEQAIKMIGDELKYLFEPW